MVLPGEVCKVGLRQIAEIEASVKTEQLFHSCNKKRKCPKMPFPDKLKMKAGYQLPQKGQEVMTQELECLDSNMEGTSVSQNEINPLSSSITATEAEADDKIAKCNKRLFDLNKELDCLSNRSHEVLEKLKNVNTMYKTALEEKNAHAAVRTKLISLKSFMDHSSKDKLEKCFDSLNSYLEKCERKNIPDAEQKLIHSCVQSFLFPNPRPVAASEDEATKDNADKELILIPSSSTSIHKSVRQMNVEVIIDPTETAAENDPKEEAPQ